MSETVCLLSLGPYCLLPTRVLLLRPGTSRLEVGVSHEDTQDRVEPVQDSVELSRLVRGGSEVYPASKLDETGFEAAPKGPPTLSPVATDKSDSHSVA